ncbi:CMGC/CK2 protein kinase [Thecamonas trahens ATCC 50062]|uniref:non-specific serine/threonine protein kinase n=1 Tax=Thecamonas trahens ATCC 50062 TaxID=461836 RepID=A0A0L0D5I1_THETB|nr:CMGC/CK2 protein kinase [Thecamonas trahens ATCC 50062]KNC47594.1 CMGC/CK2 protein kinase [Thecamonas trahens ATCC 50062]|eukprot:XP_013759523.1 CMGC/CK2 protein kinase [Thecamonas trahens ATCC 50062]
MAAYKQGSFLWGAFPSSHESYSSDEQRSLSTSRSSKRTMSRSGFGGSMEWGAPQPRSVAKTRRRVDRHRRVRSHTGSTSWNAGASHVRCLETVSDESAGSSSSSSHPDSTSDSSDSSDVSGSASSYSGSFSSDSVTATTATAASTTEPDGPHNLVAAAMAMDRLALTSSSRRREAKAKAKDKDKDKDKDKSKSKSKARSRPKSAIGGGRASRRARSESVHRRVGSPSPLARDSRRSSRGSHCQLFSDRLHQRRLTPFRWTRSLKRYRIDRSQSMGEGGQSFVFRGTDKETGEPVVVKVTKTAADAREAAILQRVHSGPNVISLLDMIKTDDEHILILESIGSPSQVGRSFSRLTACQAQFYFCKLLIALEYCHSRNIIHGDVKNGNVIFNASTKSLRLIDFGHAIHHRLTRPKRRWMGTPTYKAPEVLLHYPRFDYAVDMWAAGVMLARALIHKHFIMPLKSKSAPDLTHPANLRAIISLLGTDAYAAFVKKYSLKSASANHGLKASRLKSDATLPRSAIPLRDFSPHAANVDPRALDLIAKLLRIDPAERLTASQALNHPYMSSVKSDVEAPSEHYAGSRPSSLAASPITEADEQSSLRSADSASSGSSGSDSGSGSGSGSDSGSGSSESSSTDGSSSGSGSSSI